MPGTHADDMCKNKTCREEALQETYLQAVSKVAQRVQRQCTAYYCGYSFKVQPTGKKCLRGVAESLNYLTTGMQDKTAGQQWHRITHRVLTDLQHRVMRRTAPEEWNLSAYYHHHDPTNAEFMRTYRSTDFKGQRLLRRLEAEEKGAAERESLKVVPKSEEGVEEKWLRHFEDLYGYRGTHKSVFLLSPWEFLSLWEVVEITGDMEIADNDQKNVAYPEIPGDIQLRDKFFMRRRLMFALMEALRSTPTYLPIRMHTYTRRFTPRPVD